MRLLYSFFIFIVLFSSCRTSSEYSKSYTPALQESAGGDSSREKLETEIDSDRKVLFSANITLAVKEPDSTNIEIERIAKKYDGYINEIGTYRTIIRVKSSQLESTIDELSTLGKVRNKNLHGEDVTENYLDFKIRLDNAEKSRNRYLELLQKAETVQEILLVEKELERLNETIEMLKGRMNRIDHLDEFSTVTIILREHKKLGILGYIGFGVYHTIKWLFVRN